MEQIRHYSTPPVVVRNYSAITEPIKIGQLLRAIDGYQGQPSTEYALKLLPLVFVRPGELRCAEWPEFDLDSSEWRTMRIDVGTSCRSA